MISQERLREIKMECLNNSEYTSDMDVVFDLASRGLALTEIRSKVNNLPVVRSKTMSNLVFKENVLSIMDEYLPKRHDPYATEINRELGILGQ